MAFLVAGRMTDRLGTRKAFAIAIIIWSFAAMAPGAATSVPTFAVAMFFLGIGEATNFPVCIKTVAEWFPQKERALATGIFNSGANIGNLLVPLVVPFLTLHFSVPTFAVAMFFLGIGEATNFPVCIKTVAEWKIRR